MGDGVLLLVTKRLDFVTMMLSPPEGNNTNCNSDQFLVTGGSRVPPICGTNSGQHSTAKQNIDKLNHFSNL